MQQQSLKRSIGVFGLLLSAVGGIVGSGWLLGPFYAAHIAGPASILSWLIGGLLMMVIALSFAELASAFPVAGGTLRYLDYSHGPFVSFTVGWIAWLASASVAPIETLALLQYASNYIPGLIKSVNGAHLLTISGFFAATVLMAIMVLINWAGAKVLSRTNAFVVVLKVLVPVVTLLILFALDFHASNFTAAQFAPTGFKGILTALPAAGIIFSFIGYSPAIQLAGEAKNPQKAIPFAIIGALILCIILYVLLEVAFIGALPASSFAHGWTHLSFQGDSGPFAGIAITLGAIWLSKVLFIDAAISPFGTGLIYTAATSRMNIAMGNNGYVPKWFLKLNRYKVPQRILVTNFLIGLALFLPFPSWQKMMSFLVSALVLAYTVGPLALNVLRKQHPNLQRPFTLKAPLLLTFFGFYICNLIIFWTGWAIVSKMMIAIVVGYMAFALFRLFGKESKLNLQWKAGWWVVPYLILITILSYLGSFGGGKNILPFGWDFLAVFVVSTLVYCVAQSCGLTSSKSKLDEGLII